jgi:predicted cupin superfamily sugar epimerase
VRFKSAEEAISALGLLPLDGEGGYFSTSHRDEFGNSIYFLMAPGEFSAWHKLSERETWVYLDGAPVEIFTRTDSSTTTLTTLAREDGEMLLSIEPQTWMAARTTEEFSLVLCFLAPPFSTMTLLSRELFNQWKKIEPGIPELLHE